METKELDVNSMEYLLRRLNGLLGVEEVVDEKELDKQIEEKIEEDIKNRVYNL